MDKKSQKKPVILLSTKGTVKSVEKVKKRYNGDEIQMKPDMIDQNNKYMEGVDGSDQMMYCYLDERRTLKYWKKDNFSRRRCLARPSSILCRQVMVDMDSARLQIH
ncbi:hypothetical protein J6590_012377 [Homalodisca vitripennis]|nr:hypothetical protein J6590_012377 [Homalodisca vitripennis]